jgi:hypothetical protein
MYLLRWRNGARVVGPSQVRNNTDADPVRADSGSCATPLRVALSTRLNSQDTSLCRDERLSMCHPPPIPGLMKSVFDSTGVSELTARINRLTPTSAPQWGKMSVDQMLAHCNVSYDMVYTDKYPAVTGLKRLLFKLFVKQAVVGPKPYAKNSPTAPQFKMVGTKNFGEERTRLIDYLNRVQRDGAARFNGKESKSFGPLTSDEWNTLFYKHLDHHLTQFGV